VTLGIGDHIARALEIPPAEVDAAVSAATAVGKPFGDAGAGAGAAGVMGMFPLAPEGARQRRGGGRFTLAE
jgi:hypothetical protein